MEKKEEFPERFFRLVKERGMTVKQLTQKLGIAEKAPYWWRSRRVYPDALTACMIARELNVSAEYLVLGERKHDGELSEIAELSKRILDVATRNS